MFNVLFITAVTVGTHGQRVQIYTFISETYNQKVIWLLTQLKSIPSYFK